MRVLVVGGGITGLAAARALARDGIAVTVVEAGPRLGGKVSTERVDGLVIEHGPDSFLSTRPAAVTLARELGLGDDLVGTRDPRAVYIRHRGELVPMPDGLGLVLPTKVMPFARSRLFTVPEKLRMAKDVVWPVCIRTGLAQYTRKVTATMASRDASGCVPPRPGPTRHEPSAMAGWSFWSPPVEHIRGSAPSEPALTGSRSHGLIPQARMRARR